MNNRNFLSSSLTETFLNISCYY